MTQSDKIAEERNEFLKQLVEEHKLEEIGPNDVTPEMMAKATGWAEPTCRRRLAEMVERGEAIAVDVKARFGKRRAYRMVEGK